MYRGRATLFVTTIVTVAILASCTWREGRYVYITVYDADTDTDTDTDSGIDADVEGDTHDSGDGGCDLPDGEWLGAEGLLTLIAAETPDLAIIDVRPTEACRAGRIPGALCHPWVDGGFAEPLEPLEDRGWIVFYDFNGEAVEQVLDAIPIYCDRTVALLTDGFGAWEAAGFDIETDEP